MKKYALAILLGLSALTMKAQQTGTPPGTATQQTQTRLTADGQIILNYGNNKYDTTVRKPYVDAISHNLSNAVQRKLRGQENKDLNLNVVAGIYDMYIPDDPAVWYHYPTSGYGTLTVLRSQYGVTQSFTSGNSTWVRAAYGTNITSVTAPWVLTSAKYATFERGDSLVSQVGQNTLLLTQKAGTVEVNDAMNTKVDKQQGYNLVSDVDAAKLNGLVTDFLIRYPDDFVSTTSYVNTQLANKTYRVIPIGNDDGTNYYPNAPELNRFSGSPMFTINTSGGFTLASGYAARNGDRFRITGVGAVPPNFLNQGDLVQSYTPPPENKATALYTGQAWSAGSPSVLAANANYTAVISIPLTSGNSVVIAGVTGSLTGTFGRFVDVNGNFISSLTSATNLTGGVYRVTCPANAAIREVRFNLPNSAFANFGNLVIQYGTAYQQFASVKLKESTIPKIAYNTSDLLNDMNFVKGPDIFSLNAPQLISAKYVGQIWSGGNPSVLTANAPYTATNDIPASASAKFTLQGISATTLNFSQFGRFKNASGGVVSSITTANVSPISGKTGAYVLTVPADVTITAFALNLANVDGPGIVVQSGDKIISSVLKPELVTAYVPDSLKKFPDFSGLLNSSILFDPAAPDLAIPKMPNSFWNTGGANVYAAAYHSFPKINTTANTTYTIGGLSARPGALSTGRYFNGAGAVVANVASTDLLPVAGGFKFITPADTTIKSVAFFFDTATVPDINKLTLQLGGAVSIPQVKTPLLAQSPESEAKAGRQYTRGRTFKLPPVTYYAPHYAACAQSNGDGRAAKSELPASYTSNGSTIPGVMINNSRNNTVNLNWHTYNNTDFGMQGTDTVTLWSYHLPLFQKIIAYQRSKSGHSTDYIYVTQRTLGGTSISPDVLGEGAGRWCVDYEKIPSNLERLSVTAATRILNSMASTNGTQFNKQLTALFWNQGEGDRNDAANYYQYLKDLIYFFRGLADNPKMPVVLYGIGTFTAQYNGTVDDAKKKLADNIPNVYYIPAPPDLSYYNSDKLHLNGAGNEYVATQTFNLMTSSADKKAEFGLLP